MGYNYGISDDAFLRKVLHLMKAMPEGTRWEFQDRVLGLAQRMLEEQGTNAS